MDGLVQILRKRHGLADDATVGVKAGAGVGAMFDAARREIAFIANTADVDLEDEVVIPEGALPENGGMWDYFQKNGWKMPFGHDYGGLSVGRLTREPELKSQGWFCRSLIARTELGEDIIRLAEDGIMPAFSIGFQAMKWGPPSPAQIKKHGPHRSIVEAWHWLETSFTYMPMNASAQVVGEGKGIEARAGEERERVASILSRAVERNRISRKSASVFGLPERKAHPVGRIVILG